MGYFGSYKKATTIDEVNKLTNEQTVIKHCEMCGEQIIPAINSRVRFCKECRKIAQSVYEKVARKRHQIKTLEKFVKGKR